MITQDRLDELWEAAKRDDMHTIIVPSDVRSLIHTIRELQEQLADLQATV